MIVGRSIWHSIVFYGLEYIGRFYSSYRGFVVDNNDPLKMNRVKIVTPTINRYDKTGFWAYPKTWGGKNYGVNMLPMIGDMVWIEFEHGDLNYPIWHYASYGENEIPEEFDSPNKYGFKTPAGSIIIINDVAGEEEILVKHSNSKEYIQLVKEKSTLEATQIYLGEAGDEKALLGDTTKEKLDAILDQLTNLITALNTHTHPAPNMPSTDLPISITPINVELSNIKTTLVSILSNKVKIDK